MPEDCRAVSEVLERVGDKWSVLVVVMLGDGPKQFNELRRSIARQRMLTLTLRGLERDGLVTRTVFPTIPPRVDYELTELDAPSCSLSVRLAVGRARTEREFCRPGFNSMQRDGSDPRNQIGRVGPEFRAWCLSDAANKPRADLILQVKGPITTAGFTHLVVDWQDELRAGRVPARCASVRGAERTSALSQHLSASGQTRKIRACPTARPLHLGACCKTLPTATDIVDPGRAFGDEFTP